ncbi:MAG TPA: MBL fold metallo-hydrolase [Ktedonobacterales bacterium]|nr:MBL fold metallo-hydrolase [Ktedonobacterales bacterium]
MKVSNVLSSPSNESLQLARTAEVHVLTTGYARPDADNSNASRVASTVAYVRDGAVRVIIDPGMVAHRDNILVPLATLGESPDSVTDVVISHHHPDHTLLVALFPNARVHDFQAIYRDDSWIRRPAEGYCLSPAIQLIATPGHTPQDITTLAGTPDDIVAFTHLWWMATGPANDPYSHDPALLHENRKRVLRLATLIVPGHGEPFRPGPETPR